VLSLDATQRLGQGSNLKNISSFVNLAFDAARAVQMAAITIGWGQFPGNIGMSGDEVLLARSSASHLADALGGELEVRPIRASSTC
jgi:hypothetical protein